MAAVPPDQRKLSLYTLGESSGETRGERHRAALGGLHYHYHTIVIINIC